MLLVGFTSTDSEEALLTIGAADQVKIQGRMWQGSIQSYHHGNLLFRLLEDH